MNMNEFQSKALATAIYPPEEGLTYTVLGLASEAGEVAGKLKKAIRDNNGMINRAAMREELGDCLWYIAACCRELGYDLDALAADVLLKLADRAARDQLPGDGDDR